MSDCLHLDFTAGVEIHRLFNTEEDTAIGETLPADSLAIDVKAECAACGKAVRFEGPIGVNVGAGARPTVSLDGTELRATGHMGENGTPFIGVRFGVAR